VANIEMYEKASGDLVPNIMIVIDNYDAVREADFVDEFNKIITQTAREGASLGIHLAISAGRQNAMRMPLLSNLKVQIALYLIDASEARAIVGKTDVEVEEIQGRGLIKLEDPTLFQTMLPTEGAEALEIIDNIQAIAKQMDEHWQGERPEEIPMMPEGVIDFEQFRKRKKTKEIVQKELLPLGLEFEEVLPISFDPIKFGHLTAVSDRAEGLERMTQALAKSMTMLTDAYQTTIIDTGTQALAEIGKSIKTYIAEPESVVRVKADLLSEINNRMDNKVDGPKWLVLIADLKDFGERSKLEEEELSVLFDQSAKVGIHFIIVGNYNYIGTSFEQIPKYVRNQSTVGLVSMRLGDQDLFKQPFISREKYPNPYECYYAMDHQHVKIKIPE